MNPNQPSLMERSETMSNSQLAVILGAIYAHSQLLILFLWMMFSKVSEVRAWSGVAIAIAVIGGFGLNLMLASFTRK